MADYRGDAEEKAAEMKIELPVNAHLPHDYVPGERLRLEAYRKLASALTTEAIEEVLAELVDMYPGSQSKPALDAVLIPKPKTARVGGRDLQDAEILEWANGVIRNIFSDAPLAVS